MFGRKGLWDYGMFPELAYRGALCSPLDALQDDHDRQTGSACAGLLQAEELGRSGRVSTVVREVRVLRYGSRRGGRGSGWGLACDN